MRPQSVGVAASRLVLGKHSGRHAVRVCLERLGYVLTDEQLGEVFIRFKERADRMKHISEEELAALLPDEIPCNDAGGKMAS